MKTRRVKIGCKTALEALKSVEVKAPGKIFTSWGECKECPIPRWRQRGWCSACATLWYKHRKKVFLSPVPLVIWEEKEVRKHRRKG